MQEQNTVMTYIPVPTELLEEAGISSSDVMQMHNPAFVEQIGIRRMLILPY